MTESLRSVLEFQLMTAADATRMITIQTAVSIRYMILNLSGELSGKIFWKRLFMGMVSSDFFIHASQQVDCYYQIIKITYKYSNLTCIKNRILARSLAGVGPADTETSLDRCAFMHYYQNISPDEFDHSGTQVISS